MTKKPKRKAKPPAQDPLPHELRWALEQAFSDADYYHHVSGSKMVYTLVQTLKSKGYVVYKAAS